MAWLHGLFFAVEVTYAAYAEGAADNRRGCSAGPSAKVNNTSATSKRVKRDSLDDRCTTSTKEQLKSRTSSHEN
jgi:hypothetical protein